MFRHVSITVITLDGKRVRRRVRAAPGMKLTPAGIDRILESQANQLEEAFPGRAFRLVPLQSCAFNLIEVPVPHGEEVSA
jgi:hypothetical protein